MSFALLVTSHLKLSILLADINTDVVQILIHQDLNAKTLQNNHISCGLQPAYPVAVQYGTGGTGRGSPPAQPWNQIYRHPLPIC